MKFKKNIISLFALLSFLTVYARAQTGTNIVTVNIADNNFKVSAGEEFTVEINTKINRGWHINSNRPNDEFLIPTTVSSLNENFIIEEATFPPAKEFKLPFSDKPASVYEGEIKIEVKIKSSKTLASGSYEIPIELGYQACNDRTCMPPDAVIKIINVEIINGGTVKNVPADPKEEQKNIDTAANSSIQLPEESDPVTIEATISILAAIVFAFFGGMILNLMPCVLPVLSLKIMGIVEQAGEDPKEKLKHGLLFTIGVLISFWILAGLLLILRAGGEQLGWGFQLQSPGFVVVLSIFLFLFGLSMFGVFEIGATLTAVGQGKRSKSAYMGSFTSGVLATVVATPCTAPFMGSALGYALSQPAYVSLLVFTILGLGMAAPYLVLTSIPKLLRFIPKPGAWMETMKQFMGFLLMATVLWLLWVLSLQTGSEGVIILLGSLILISIGGWIYGRWGNIAKTPNVRRTAQVISTLMVVGAISFSLKKIEAKTTETRDIHKQGTIEWKAFSPELVEELRADNKPVFVDYTAAWCLSCQVNEKVAFGSEEVQKAFAEKGIVTLKADWTNKDETITKALAEFGRNSVPLYVYYAPGKDAVILPEIITSAIVLEKIRVQN
ncbi:MAG: thioredoxin family protein [Ignavibacteria bacterium]|jgi:thiol:disulfide interchange protein DsbD